jgi:hypothetical protein
LLYGLVGDLRAVRFLLGYAKVERADRYLSFGFDGALALAGQTDA